MKNEGLVFDMYQQIHTLSNVFAFSLSLSLSAFPSTSPQLDAPFVPKCKSAGDPSNFDDYEEEPLRISSTEKFAKEFADF